MPLDRRTHCRRGHEMTEENSRWRTVGKYRLRGCRACLKACARLKYRASMTGQAASERVRAWEFSARGQLTNYENVVR